MSSDWVACVVHASIAGVSAAFLLERPSLVATVIFSGLMSLTYGIRWAVRSTTTNST